LKMRQWILENALSDEATLQEIELTAKATATAARKSAWEKYIAPIKQQVKTLAAHGQAIVEEGLADKDMVQQAIQQLKANREPLRRELLKPTASILVRPKTTQSPALQALQQYYDQPKQQEREIYTSHLYAVGANSALNVPEVPAVYADTPQVVNGYEVLN